MSRPVLPWRSPLVLLPPPSTAVWVRRIAFYDTPVRVTSDDSGLFLFHIPTAATPRGDVDAALTYNEVHTWKFQFLADETAYRNSRGPDDPR